MARWWRNQPLSSAAHVWHCGDDRGMDDGGGDEMSLIQTRLSIGLITCHNHSCDLIRLTNVTLISSLQFASKDVLTAAAGNSDSIKDVHVFIPSPFHMDQR